MLWFVAEWTKVLDFRWLRLSCFICGFFGTQVLGGIWTFSVFFRCLVIGYRKMPVPENPGKKITI